MKLTQKRGALIAWATLSMLACADHAREAHDPIVLPSISLAGPGSEVVAIRSDVAAVRSALEGTLDTWDWFRLDHNDVTRLLQKRSAVILQLPTQAWTLFISVAGRWSTHEIAARLSRDLRTTVVSYARSRDATSLEDLEVWRKGAAQQIIRFDGMRSEGAPAVKLHFREIFAQLLSSERLHLPEACNGEPSSISKLLAQHPRASGYGFGFYGTSGRTMKPISRSQR